MNDVAQNGYIFKCMHCGKESKTRYGFLSDGSSRGSDKMPDGSWVSDSGYDESCMLSSELRKK